MVIQNRSILLVLYALLLRVVSKVMPFCSTPWGMGAFFAPAIGFFARPSTCFMLYGIRTATSLAIFDSFGPCVTYVPTLAGSLVLSTGSKLFKVGIPVVCAGAFIIHPVGGESWLYAAYWLIPIGLGLFSDTGIFLRSIASTFTTHAVGSVIYLYTHTTTSLYWHSLIGRVWYERLSYALILTISYFLVSSLIQLITTLRTEGKVCHGQLSSL